MKILLCGGGTGGHITPILAIAHEIKVSHPDCRVIYVGEHGSKFRQLTENSESIDEFHAVFAGKFRRYHKESWLRRLTDVKTNVLNLRDLFYFGFGTLQSVFLIKKIKPDAVFLKGGYVGLPVGIASSFWNIPYATHESDAIPGITNRITSKKATFNAVGFQNGTYNYKSGGRTVYTGIPVRKEVKYVSEGLKMEYRKKLDIPLDAKVLLITGGSLGAARVNGIFAETAERLLEKFNDLYIFHTVGKGNLSVYDNFPKSERLRAFEFIKDFYEYSGASDLVITRGGANTMAELAVQAKACIIVPNPQLVGGHQIRNAEQFVKANAAIVVSEDDLLRDKSILFNQTASLLHNEDTRKQMSQNIQNVVKPDATKTIATELVALAEKGKHV